MSEFNVGDRVRATDEIDEGESVQPGDEGEVIDVKDSDLTSYPYVVLWDRSGLRSEMISDEEIELIQPTSSLENYVKRSDLEAFLDEWFSGTWRMDGKPANVMLRKHNLLPPVPKKRIRVEFEVDDVDGTVLSKLSPSALDSALGFPVTGTTIEVVE